METFVFAAVMGLGALAAATGIVRLCAAFRRFDEERSALVLMRGGRRLIVGVALVVIAAGALADSDSLLTFGVVFLLEEIYETTLVIALLEWNASEWPRPRTVPPGADERPAVAG